MVLIKWSVLIATSFAAVIIAIVAIGTLFSLDWSRTHAAETAKLPLFEAGQSDGLARIQARGMEFRARVYGASNNGPGVILLHGFPETSVMWEPLAKAAAARGFRVVAFDQRGYSPGARLKGVSPYAAGDLIDDVIGVADAVGFERFHLVGHDWGCSIAWAVGMSHSDRVLSLNALSIPHPNTLLTQIAENPPLYVRIRTQPWIPEISLLFNNKAGLRARYVSHGSADVDEYMKVFSEPGALTAALNWYRALPASIKTIQTYEPKIALSTLFIYGADEFWVTPEALEEQRKLMVGDYEEIKLEAGHWVIQEQPERVVQAVLGHMTGAAGN